MSLKPFTYPFPETRFLHAGPSVYKFKIRYGNSIRGEEIEKKEVISQELEDSIRVVLGNLDDLQPFATEHFIVFPYKSKWERVSHLKFKHGDMALVPYPFVFTLYVELKWFHENLSPGKSINDSPPGLVLADRKAAGAMMRKWKCMQVPRSPSMPRLDRLCGPQDLHGAVRVDHEGADPYTFQTQTAVSQKTPSRGSIKMVTSSQGPRKKKPLVETRRNRERKTQQEWQETPAFDDTDVQEQDSKWVHSLAGQITPPLQQNNSPPPRGPTEQGTSGFFGFLSSFFPFWDFFRKSGQRASQPPLSVAGGPPCSRHSGFRK